MIERQLLLPDGHTLAYRLVASARRRSVGLRIDRNGLTVSSPTRIARRALDDILRQKADWIVAKLREWQAKQPASIDWRDGTRLLYLGHPILLRLSVAARSRAAQCSAGSLQLALPEPDCAKTVERRVLAWYRQAALEDFSRRLELLASRLGVAPPPLFLSSARTRWGSCNSRGEIRLNWRLIQAPPHIIHYVAAHELAHLKEMNHSPRFWAVVATLCPDYRAARQQLKALSAQLHVL
jgi:hypothetical protein